MKRIKIKNNFFLDEFIHPDIYKIFGAQSIKYLNKNLVDLVQTIRDKFSEDMGREIGIFINTWATGGEFINSGLRDFLNPLKKGSRSRHYYGLCADLKVQKGEDEKDLYRHILKYKDFYFEKGLTVIENYNFTEGWVHVSVEWTNEEEIQIINP